MCRKSAVAHPHAPQGRARRTGGPTCGWKVVTMNWAGSRSRAACRASILATVVLQGARGGVCGAAGRAVLAGAGLPGQVGGQRASQGPRAPAGLRGSVLTLPSCPAPPCRRALPPFTAAAQGPVPPPHTPVLGVQRGVDLVKQVKGCGVAALQGQASRHKGGARLGRTGWEGVEGQGAGGAALSAHGWHSGVAGRWARQRGCVQRLSPPGWRR